ncbi:hypothetical protein [Methylosinus sporium]|uniref:hypothetical protein n=1 Tax=Methylosinus sporium TaxID=428 RepID=UPI00383BC6FF
MFERKGANRRSSGAAHSAAAVVAALLLILQSLVTVAAPAHSARLGAAAGLAPICALDAPADPKAPARDHARSHCCLPGESCDGSAPPFVVESIAAPRRPPILALAAFSWLSAPPRGPPEGWASSWSSRAPPAVS